MSNRAEWYRTWREARTLETVLALGEYNGATPRQPSGLSSNRLFMRAWCLLLERCIDNTRTCYEWQSPDRLWRFMELKGPGGLI